MARAFSLKDTRNIGIMAHIDAGNCNRAYFVLHWENS